MNQYEQKDNIYAIMLKQLTALLEDEHDMIANMANTAAVLYHTLPAINWAGFYLYKDGELILGPFQGKAACMHIPMNRGVCGTSAAKCEPLVVKDVHSFAGHIACDAASKSEIVIPITKENTLFGVLDIDSPIVARFDESDKKGLCSIVELLQSL